MLACTLLASAHAQNARQVLDNTAAQITQSPIKATFKVTQFNGTSENGSTSGVMWMHGRKFKMDTPDMITWYDGHTEWTMLKGSNEVNVNEPTPAEQQAINPYAFINIYKKGYNLSMTKGTLRGKATYIVTMRAKKKNSIPTVIVDIDSNTYAPLCIRALRDGDWTRLSVLTFGKESIPESTFTFPADDYPDTEIIDLR